MTLTVVLGMHRSGTSALAKFLGRLGLDSGDRLLPANEHNADGHFEDIDVLAINESILSRLRTVWHLPLNPQRLTQALDRGDLSREFGQATELIRDRIGRYPNWFVKEPRLSLLMPFWQRVFAQEGIAVRYVWMTRHPAQVDASLRARDQLGGIHNAQTWLSYQLSILESVQDCPTYLLDYETLIGDRSDWLSDFASFLGLDSSLPEIEEIRKDSVSSDLQRQRMLTSCDSGLTSDLYMALKNAQPSRLDFRWTDALSREWAPFARALYASWDWASDLDLKNRDLLVQVGELAETAESNLAQAQTNLAQVQVQMAEAERLAKDLAAQREAVSVAQGQVSALSVKASELSVKVEGLTSELLKTRELLTFAEQRASEREHQLSLVLNSVSWKLTKPLRWLKKTIAGR